jgi:serine/threonine protein kinase
MSDASTSHPSLERLAAFDRGRLSPTDWEEVERHLTTCDVCCQQLESLPDDMLLQLMRAAACPARDTPSRRDDSTGVSIGAGAEAEVPPELIGHPRYRVLEFLGAGGMGTVFKAQHLLMDRTVALKVIHNSLMARPEAVERFRLEVKAAARLAHPNIVTAHDAEQVGDVHFLVMEYVEGSNLDRVVAARGPLPVELACHLVQQAAQGLQHAHERGMIHRDIKPGNLLLTSDGQVKVTDFGLARLTSTADRQTPFGVLVGTPDYIAPEQARNARQADIRADIYSLGCTLHYLLAGRPPFEGESLTEKLLAHQTQSPGALSDARADVAPELAAVVRRMLAKDPADRYQTPGEVAQTLAPFVQNAPYVNLSWMPPSSTASPLSQLPTCVVSPRRRWRGKLLAGALGLAALGGLVAVGLAPGPREAAHVNPSGSVVTKTTEDATPAQRPHPRLLTRRDIRDKMAAWVAQNHAFQPGRQFPEKTVTQLDDRLKRNVGFIYELGAGMVKSNRPTIVLGRCGTLHVFALTNAQARNFKVASNTVVHSDLRDDDILSTQAPFELSELVIDNALQLDGDQPITGTVTVRNLGFKGPPVLRLGYEAADRWNSYTLPLTEELPAGPTPLQFAVGCLNNKEIGRRVGPYVVCLEFCSMKNTKDRPTVTVLSNSVAAVVNVSRAPQP